MVSAPRIARWPRICLVHHMKSASCVFPMLSLAFLMGCQPVAPRVPSPFGQPTADAPLTTRGVILSVERPRPDDSQAFVHVVIAPADQQPIRLVLAPGWYLQKSGLRFEAREPVEVRGKYVVQNGEPSIVVQSVRQGDRSYVLRDERERPAWLEPSEPASWH